MSNCVLQSLGLTIVLVFHFMCIFASPCLFIVALCNNIDFRVVNEKLVYKLSLLRSFSVASFELSSSHFCICGSTVCIVCLCLMKVPIRRAFAKSESFLKISHRRVDVLPSIAAMFGVATTVWGKQECQLSNHLSWLVSGCRCAGEHADLTLIHGGCILMVAEYKNA